MKKNKNVLIFFIDALRYDLVSNPDVRKAFMPMIDKLLDNGFYSKVVANAGATQYVLPSLLTESYPFDYGGYNEGILHRPKSIIELFKENEYTTYATVSSYLYLRVPGFFRGFDWIRGLYPILRVINKVIIHQLKHELKLWKDGEKSKEETIKVVQYWFRIVLGDLLEYCENHPKTKWTNGARRRNEKLGPKIRKELELVETEPDIIIEKLLNVDPVYYWTTFGKRKPGLGTKLIKIRDSVYTRTMKSLFWTGLFPRQLKYQDMPLDEMILDVPEFLQHAKKLNKPWLMYVHNLNIHSFHVFPGLYHQLMKYKLLFKCIKLRRKLGRSWQPLMHDLTLMDLDKSFAKMLSDLKDKDELDNTVIAIFGDHGRNLGDRGAKGDSDRGFRTHRAFLETVYILSGVEVKITENVMIDSLGVGATLLDVLNMEPDKHFKGVSALSGGLDYVISETAGRGHCDLERKDLYFTITSKTHKLFTVLVEDKLNLLALVDIEKDPDELVDIKDNPENLSVINNMLEALFNERKLILENRGFDFSLKTQHTD